MLFTLTCNLGFKIKLSPVEDRNKHSEEENIFFHYSKGPKNPQIYSKDILLKIYQAKVPVLECWRYWDKLKSKSRGRKIYKENLKGSICYS